MLNLIRSISNKTNAEEINQAILHEKEKRIPSIPTSILDEIIEKTEDEAKTIESYSNLCAEIDFYPPQLFKKQFLAFCIKENIPIYDLAKVTKYLCFKANEESNKLNTISYGDEVVWVWKPLRKKDSNLPSFKSALMSNYKFPSDYHGSFGDPCPRNTLYDKLVPSFILNRVKKIENKFGDIPKFFVSDYQAIKPDPFIMVTMKGLKESIVFGVWDEPGF